MPRRLAGAETDTVGRRWEYPAFVMLPYCTTRPPSWKTRCPQGPVMEAASPFQLCPHTALWKMQTRERRPQLLRGLFPHFLPPGQQVSPTMTFLSTARAYIIPFRAPKTEKAVPTSMLPRAPYPTLLRVKEIWILILPPPIFFLNQVSGQVAGGGERILTYGYHANIEIVAWGQRKAVQFVQWRCPLLGSGPVECAWEELVLHAHLPHRLSASRLLCVAMNSSS